MSINKMETFDQTNYWLLIMTTPEHIREEDKVEIPESMQLDLITSNPYNIKWIINPTKESIWQSIVKNDYRVIMNEIDIDLQYKIAESCWHKVFDIPNCHYTSKIKAIKNFPLNKIDNYQQDIFNRLKIYYLIPEIISNPDEDSFVLYSLQSYLLKTKILNNPSDFLNKIKKHKNYKEASSMILEVMEKM